MAVKIVCIAFFALLLLDLSVYRSHGSLLRRSVDSPKDSVTCSLKTKRIWNRHINWTRLNQTGLSGVNMVFVLNSYFVIDYCSGLCDPIFLDYNAGLLKDNYARQMYKLANELDRMKLMPCCVAKRYHGQSNPTRIKFKTKKVLVRYIDKSNLDFEREYYHTFLEPVACHCQ